MASTRAASWNGFAAIATQLPAIASHVMPLGMGPRGLCLMPDTAVLLADADEAPESESDTDESVVEKGNVKATIWSCAPKVGSPDVMDGCVLVCQCKIPQI